MATGSEAGHAPALELAHVLFMDIVAYSRLSTDEQERVLRELQAAVRGTAEFARAQAADQLISLPTGDGMALVFFGDPESPVRCARELAPILRTMPDVPLRMGIHTGPVYRIQDINANRNVAGGGINFAQRVMDCADAGQILLSRATADVLRQISGYDALLHDLGEAEVKHGVKVHIVNLYGDGFGNALLPSKLRAAKRKRRTRSNAMLGAALVLTLAASMVALYFARRTNLRVNVVAEKPRRSVAVMGFRNLSGRPEAAWLSTALAQMFSTELAAGEKLRALPGETVAQAKLDLSLPDSDALSKETLDKVRKRLGADLVVLGSYVDIGGEGHRKLRVDVRVQDTSQGETILTTSAEGAEDSVFDIVSRCGGDLRSNIGAGRISQAEAETVKAALPANPDAARLYAEGLARLRAFDALGARDLLQKAVAADPTHALAQAALSDAWSALGYRSKAAEASKRALALSASLSREDKLWITGQDAIARYDWAKAVETYQTLFTFFPDNVEYGLKLASTQQSAGSGSDALTTVQALRKLPPPLSDDPRIDLAEGDAAQLVSDNKRALAAYTNAEHKATDADARQLVAKALDGQGWVQAATGNTDAALGLFNQARQIFSSANDRSNLAKVLGNTAVALRRKDAAASRGMFQQELAVAREVGDTIQVARALNSLANILWEQSDMAGARPLFDEALRTARESGDRHTALVVEGNFAGLLLDEGNLGGAKRLRQQAIDDANAASEKTSEAISLGGLAEVLYTEGNLSGAIDAFTQALTIVEATGDRPYQAQAIERIGDMLWAQDKLDEARARYLQVAKLYSELGDSSSTNSYNLYATATQVEKGDIPPAIPLLRAAIGECQKQKDKDSEIIAETYLAEALLATGDAAGAAGEFARIPGLLGDEPMGVSTKVLGARIDAAQGHADTALRSLQALLHSPNLRRVDDQLQVRLGIAQIEFAAGRAEGSRDLEQVAKDASAKGFALIARQANDALKRRRG